MSVGHACAGPCCAVGPVGVLLPNYTCVMERCSAARDMAHLSQCSISYTNEYGMLWTMQLIMAACVRAGNALCAVMSVLLQST
jgi:hypothetical protein